MKQRLYLNAVIMLLLALLLLSACSSGEQKASTSSPEPTTKAAEAPKKEAEAPKAADLHQKAADAAGKVSGYSAKMKLTQTITQGKDKMEIKTDIDMQSLKKPEPAYHQKKNVDMKMGDQSQVLAFDVYMSDKGGYLQDPASKNWAKVTKEMLVPLNISENEVDAVKQIEKLKPYLSELKAAEGKNDTYEIRLSASGDKMKDFIQNEMKSGSAQIAGVDLASVSLDSLKIKKLEAVYSVDKKSFQLKTAALSLEFNLTVEGQTADFVIASNIDYADWDAVKEIKVPEEVLKTAQ